MVRKQSQERSQEEFTDSAGEMHERPWSWRREELGVSFDETMERVRQEREGMMKPLMEELLGEAGEVDVCCPACGERAQNRGKKKKEIQHREGAVEVNREYYYCPSCRQGFFPLDRRQGLRRRGWSPKILEMALRQAVELSSYARAAQNFSELTNVSISAGSLQRLVLEYGRRW